MRVRTMAAYKGRKEADKQDNFCRFLESLKIDYKKITYNRHRIHFALRGPKTRPSPIESGQRPSSLGIARGAIPKGRGCTLALRKSRNNLCYQTTLKRKDGFVWMFEPLKKSL